MIPAASRKTFSAFTLIELLVVIAIIAIMVGLFGNPHRGAKVRALQTQCMSNLKQVSLGYTLWASANTNLFPWEVSTNAGGTLEMMNSSNAASHFASLATWIKSPDLLVCPSDRFRQKTYTYSGFGNSNLSYFVSMDASLGPVPSPSFLILAGDRCLSFSNSPAPPGSFEITNFTALGWTAGFHGSSTAPLGVLTFADGHCEVVKSAKLPAIFQRQTIVSNLLVIP